MILENDGSGDRLPLSALDGAALTWEDADGNEHRAAFEEEP